MGASLGASPLFVSDFGPVECGEMIVCSKRFDHNSVRVAPGIICDEAGPVTVLEKSKVPWSAVTQACACHIAHHHERPFRLGCRENQQCGVRVRLQRGGRNG